MLKSLTLEKILTVTLVFLTSLSVGYFPISAGIYSDPENANPTGASIWLAIKK